MFCCGGIGATPDDHTRQCAAAALGVDLALHPQAKELIESRMRDTAAERNGEVFDPERPDNVHRYNMGVFPVQARASSSTRTTRSRVQLRWLRRRQRAFRARVFRSWPGP